MVKNESCLGIWHFLAWQLWMNRRIQVVTWIRWEKFEYCVKGMTGGLLSVRTCRDTVFCSFGTGWTRACSWQDHWDSSNFSQSGPSHHRVWYWSSDGYKPVDAQSIGFVSCVHGSSNLVVKSQKLGTHSWLCKFWTVMDYLSISWAQWCCQSKRRFGQRAIGGIPNDVEKFSN